MKNTSKLLLVFLIMAIITASSFSNRETKVIKDDIAPYVKFLKEQHKTPMDYVMSLFEKYDIVILCERYHSEATQYNLIYDIVSDKRFINTVDNIFTEIGTSSNNKALHDFLFASNLSEKEIEKNALHLYRKISWTPLWVMYNFYDFHKKLYLLNKGLPDSQKINMYYSDMPFSWDGMTPEKYKTYKDALPERDKIMANQIIKKFKEIQKSDEPGKKALVIMNYRHAFNDFQFADGTKAGNVGKYLFEEFPGKVANVMFNSVALLPGTTDNNAVDAPIQGGKWDAAFEVTGNRDVGFNFEGSPFGNDYFDYFTFRKHNLKYKDVFNGYIFYKPLREHKLVIGIPGFFNNGYDKIIPEWIKSTGQQINESEVEVSISTYGKIQERSYKNLENFYEMINSFL